MKQKGTTIVVVLIILIVILLLTIVGGTAYYLGLQKSNLPKLPFQPSPTTQSSPTLACPTDAKICPDGTSVGRTGPACEFAPCPSEALCEGGPCPSPQTQLFSSKPGWQIFTNAQYGFQISYPATYQALTDPDNLYGWPKAVVLFYAGGQSYDLPIEVWNSVAEYEAKYQPGMTNLTVKQVKGKYITLVNSNLSTEVDEIIATFKIID